MGDRKNIDRIFQERFKSFEAVPEAHVWSAIEKKLGNRRKTPMVFPFIIRYGGIAAAIALLITLGYHINPDHHSILNNPQEGISNTHLENTDNNPATPTVDEDPAEHQISSGALVNTGIINPDRKNDKEPFQHRKKPTVKNTAFITDNAVVKNTDAATVENNNINLTNTQRNTTTNTPFSSQKRYENSTPSAIEDPTKVVAENQESAWEMLQEHKASETASADTESESLSRWSISPNAAPVYFNSLENGSPIDRQFSDNKKSGNFTASYGINIAYQFNKRLSVRSGVNRVSYGYNTNNIAFTGSLDAQSINNISYNNSAQHITVTDVNTANPSNAQSPVTASKPSAYEGKMVQEFGYIEVPLEIKYRLLNKKIGINLIGGVSSLFLTDNSISLQTDVVTTQIGTATNVNTTNFSTNIGLGFDYQVSDKMIFNVEPIFKYQLNTFSNDDGGFRPYTLGVYTGLSFRF